MLIRSRERGDTVIEVLLAIAVLSTAAVGVFAIMNRSTAYAYGVLERTETRARVSQQLELTAYFRDRYVDTSLKGLPTDTYPANVWADIKLRAASTAPNSTDPASCQPNPNSFYIAENPDGTYQVASYSVVVPQTTPRAGSGLWVEAARSPAGVSVAYVDVYVKSCWQSIGGNQQETISSVVRLYDR